MQVMGAARRREEAGHEILHLEVGQPSTSAPAAVIAAAHAALENDRLGYTGALGLPELRDRISRWYRDRYGLLIPADRIAVTTGASGSCVLSFLALWDPGANVGVIEPGYPCYRNDLEAFGINVVRIPVDAATGFRPTTADLDAAGPLDGLVLASPNNPTGTVLSQQHLAPLLKWCAAGGTQVIVDEIYHGLVFDQPAPSALEFDQEVLVFNSFSKYFSMTGWRLGWVVAPEALVPAIERLAQNLTIAPPTLSQLAGLAAFDSLEECEANVGRYRRNRDSLLGALRQSGFSDIAPADGAFYVWVDISHTGKTASALCKEWLETLNLAVTPGIDFDRERGESFVRLSIAGSEHDIVEAGERIKAWAAKDTAAAGSNEAR
ncbi:MAG: aminotransferase class I/II-fold pyridoxal phosphate-dependent enzyme [Acidimicrobiales bacterium]|nr:aminotransferase class I/II-fold pyridoxal phosphate-dependent enzyme [Acidimicrobiales bacterium]